jgi:predicted esterase
VEALVQQELDAGIPHDRIVVAGFSQGGAMALYTGLQLPHQLAGVLCMSGYLPLSEPASGLTGVFEPTASAIKTPVLMCHGKLDSMVIERRQRLRPETNEHTQNRHAYS